MITRDETARRGIARIVGRINAEKAARQKAERTILAEMPLIYLTASWTPGQAMTGRFGQVFAGTWTWDDEDRFMWTERVGHMDFLTTSIQQNGMREPILLGNNGMVWDGHHRIAAARRLAMSTVPVEIVDGPAS